MRPAPTRTAPGRENDDWLRDLDAGPDGAGRSRDAERDLHGLLLRTARAEARRRSASVRFRGPELEDLATQAADDAMLLVLDRLGSFRGESRFTTWAMKFVLFEITKKLGRHFWAQPRAELDENQWAALPDRAGVAPEASSETAELLTAVRTAADRELTAMQRDCFVAVVLGGTPLEAHAERIGAPRGSVYKAVYDARRRLRSALVHEGYLQEAP